LFTPEGWTKDVEVSPEDELLAVKEKNEEIET
jgi:hypothetical protein